MPGCIIGESMSKPRMRLIIDNDFGGDPDGLFQLAHHVLSPSVEIRGIIGSFFPEGKFFGESGSAARACRVARELLSVMADADRLSVYEGAPAGLPDLATPVVSQGATALIREAMRSDSDLPLYVVCGAGLTDIASAYLVEPAIARRLTLIWIGGPEYPGGASGQGLPQWEYNLAIDLKAAQVVFNHSDIPLWQIPRDTYRQALLSDAELQHRVRPQGRTGRFLADKIEWVKQTAKAHGLHLGETYVLGDSPLVLLTALQSAFDPDPCSSVYIERPAPLIGDAGLYEQNPSARAIRVYTRLDTRLLFEDFFQKLELSARAEGR